MRINILHFSIFAGAIAIVASAAVTGCGDLEATRAFSEPRTPGDPDRPNDETIDYSTTDAGTNGPTSLVRGSPLCNVTPDTCSPDDDGAKSYDAVACAEPVVKHDGGSDAGLAPALVDASSARACRISEGTPTCLPKVDREGTDGVSCEKATDCAAGFDCVDGEKGGACRRYCCSGSCAGFTAQNGGPTFCDVQKLVGGGDHNAPMCMPIKTCTLLTTNECTDKETCAVVTPKGDTGCVPNGKQKVDEPCDWANCGAGLTCLGNAGERRCYQLCKVGGSDCPSGKQCTTGTAFQSPTFGVCK